MEYLVAEGELQGGTKTPRGQSRESRYKQGKERKAQAKKQQQRGGRVWLQKVHRCGAGNSVWLSKAPAFSLVRFWAAVL